MQAAEYHRSAVGVGVGVATPETGRGGGYRVERSCGVGCLVQDREGR
jgi:hypothetical protein